LREQDRPVKVCVERTADGTPGATVEDASDFSRLDVELVEVDEPLASTVLSDAGLGQIRQGYGWLDVAALRAAVVSRSGLSSEPAFDDMVRYAARHGWVSADGRSVRAHCVPRAGAPAASSQPSDG
jgi:hypothetical protein